jgi:hypothetical protein
LLRGTWYEFTEKTCDQPLPPACRRLWSTVTKAWSIWALISVTISALEEASGFQPPRTSKMARVS